MNLDLLLLGLVLFFAVLGAMAGGMMQVTHLAAVFVGGLLSRPVGVALGPKAAAHFQVPLVVGILGTTVLAFVTLYAVTQVVARVAMRKVLENPVLGKADRALGFGLAAAKTAAILFVLLSALVFFEKPLAQFKLRFDTTGSVAATWVREHNLFTSLSFPGIKGLTALSRAATNPEAPARLGQDPEFQALANDPKVRAILADGSLARGLQSGDYVSVLRSNKVLEAITDPRLAGQLTSLGGSLGELPEAPEGGGKRASTRGGKAH